MLQDSLLSMETVNLAIQTVLNVQVLLTNVQNVSVVLLLKLVVNVVFLLLNVLMDKLLMMLICASVFVIMVSFSMKDYVCSEDALMDMLIMVMVVVLEAHNHQVILQLLAPMVNSY